MKSHTETVTQALKLRQHWFRVDRGLTLANCLGILLLSK